MKCQAKQSWENFYFELWKNSWNMKEMHAEWCSIWGPQNLRSAGRVPLVCSYLKLLSNLQFYCEGNTKLTTLTQLPFWGSWNLTFCLKRWYPFFVSLELISLLCVNVYTSSTAPNTSQPIPTKTRPRLLTEERVHLHKSIKGRPINILNYQLLASSHSLIPTLRQILM